MKPQLGSVVDRSYRLLDQMGEGGMGTVYRAVQLINNQHVALKLVSLHLPERSAAENSSAVEQRLALAREFQTLASLHHPNVIRVLSYGFDDVFGSYYTMELIESPKSILDAGQSATEETKIQMLAQLLRALAYIHRRSVIHRDIKPGNILTVHDEVKLLDFGIATESGGDAELAGTLEYMAPELLIGAPPSVQSDLFSAGIVFHQLLTGAMPQKNASMTLLLDGLLGEDSELTVPSPAAEQPIEHAELPAPAISAEPPPPPPAATPIQAVLDKLVARAPEDRYDSASSTLRDLAAAVPYEIPVETAATRESFLQATVLIGRDEELSLLKKALNRTKQHSGSAILVGGESGVGKSRLLSELRTLALVHGFWVAEGQSTTDSGSYYQEWRPLLRALCFRVSVTDEEASVLKDLITDIGELLGRSIPDPPAVKPEAAQARIAGTIVELLRRQAKPALLILEDLQWARNESLGLLKQLLAKVKELPLLIVGTFRSDESPQLPESLPGMNLVPLTRLDQSNIARLSESMLGEIGMRPEFVAYLTRQTEGNVFFLVEIVRALAENAGELQRIGQGELPENVLTIGIERIVERRLDRLPESFRPYLEFAATLGRKLDLPVMERVFPELRLRSFLIECANVAVLESQGNDWRFAHDKLRESILRRIDPERSKRLHHSGAEAIEAVHTGASLDAMSAALAYHYRQAGVLDKALRYYVQAGDQATKLYLYSDARGHYAAARATLDLLEATPQNRRLCVDLLIKQVQSGLTNDPSETLLSRLAEARTHLERLAADGLSLPEDRLRMARVDYYSGRVYHYAGQPRDAIRQFQRVLPVAREFGDKDLLIMPSFVIGMALCMQGHFGKAKALLGQATDSLFQHLGVSLDSLRCILYQSIALAECGQAREALAGIEKARSWAMQLNQPVHLATFHTLHSTAGLIMADWPMAIQASERLLEVSARTHELLFHYAPLDCMAWSQSRMGQHAQALDNRARAQALRRTIGGGIIKDWFDAAEAEILLNAGRLQEALQHAQGVEAASKNAGLPFSHAIAERVWGYALAKLGTTLAEAESHFKLSLQICRDSEQVMNAAQTELLWGQCCRELGDPAGARQHFDTALQQIADGGYEYALSEARRIVSADP